MGSIFWRSRGFVRFGRHLKYNKRWLIPNVCRLLGRIKGDWCAEYEVGTKATTDPIGEHGP